METPVQVNSIKHSSARFKTDKSSVRGGKYTPQTSGKGDSRPQVRCYRCDGVGHIQSDLACPGRKVTCKKCGIRGHYDKKCRTSKQTGEHSRQRGRHSAYTVDEREEEDYAFTVQPEHCLKTDNGVVGVSVGGVSLSNILIDSGASCNLIDKNTWEYLKSKGVTCKSKMLSKKLFAYGQNKPIETLGIFECNVICSSTQKACNCEFIVVKNTGKSILGRSTAEKLNVLRVGPPNGVYTVTTEGSDEDIVARYPKLFEGVGKLKDYEFDLHIDENVKPVAQPLRRLPFGFREKVDEKLDELLEKDIIEEVNGPTKWVSPMVVVPKSRGDIRICIDMRKANEAIIRERHPIPTIEEVLFQMNGATVFSKLDLKWGFHQVVLSEKSRPITTFVTYRGLYRYKRLMFGITSAPEKYQKLVSEMLQGCNGVANIADDLIVYGSGVEEHDANLFAVFERLDEVNLTLNRSKCEFRLPKLTFFGHELGKEGIAPSEEKIGAVLNARPPETVAEVRSFLGLVQYSAKFLPNLAVVAEPMRRLTRKEVKFEWGLDQQEAFDELKRLMTKAETLAYFRNECKTRIVADAGPTGVGAVLTQLQGETWRVIAYASRGLTDVERRYSQTEKEALGLVWSCERFNLYVMGRKFELETDHKPLECIYTPRSKPCARIERWVLRLQSYDYKVVYRPGKTNIADALSRLNAKSCDKTGEKEDFVRVIATRATPVALTPKEIELESEKDDELIVVRQCIRSGDWSKCKLPSYTCCKDELCHIGQLVLRGSRIVIPKSLRPEVLRLAHEGHQGIVKTKERLRVKVWWPKMDFGGRKASQDLS